MQAWRKLFVSFLQQLILAWAYLQPARQLNVLQALYHTPLRDAAQALLSHHMRCSNGSCCIVQLMLPQEG